MQTFTQALIDARPRRGRRHRDGRERRGEPPRLPRGPRPGAERAAERGAQGGRGGGGRRRARQGSAWYSRQTGEAHPAHGCWSASLDAPEPPRGRRTDVLGRPGPVPAPEPRLRERRRAGARSRLDGAPGRSRSSSPTTSCCACGRARAQAYGVPWSVLASINKIESNFGRNMGPSSAGAIGWMQFMPSTWLRWGTDADGNGIADPWNPVDAVYSAARYLAASGGGADIRRAIFSYNHADWYVNEVVQLAQLYGSSDTAAADAFQNLPAVQRPVFALDRLQAEAGRRAHSGRAGERRLPSAAVESRGTRRARGCAQPEGPTRPRSSPTGSTCRRRPAGRTPTHTPRRREADRLKQRLDAAEGHWPSSRTEANGASFNAPARQMLSGAPVDRRGQLRLPGRRRTVDRLGLALPPRLSGRRHRRARGGAALRALGRHRAVRVELGRSAAEPGSRCRRPTARPGRTATSPTSSPTVTQGAELAAGDPVGLVGQTGHASGPHLHLQLQPAELVPSGRGSGSRASPAPPSGGRTQGQATERRDRPARRSTSSARSTRAQPAVSGSSFGPLRPMNETRMVQARSLSPSRSRSPCSPAS